MCMLSLGRANSRIVFNQKYEFHHFLPSSDDSCCSASKYNWEKIGLGTKLFERREASIELCNTSSNRVVLSWPAYEFPIFSKEETRRKKKIFQFYHSDLNHCMLMSDYNISHERETLHCPQRKAEEKNIDCSSHWADPAGKLQEVI